MPSASLASDLRASARARVTLGSALSFVAAAGITPDLWQAQVLASRAPRLLLCCSRQSGKSFVTAALTLYTALSVPRRDIVIVSRAERQAENLLRTLYNIYDDAGMPVRAVARNKHSFELANGTTIFALPCSSESIRSFSNLSLLVIDEAAFVPQELYRSVRPMLAVGGGRLVVLSSAHGKRGWFYEAWANADRASGDGVAESWERYKITAYECPRISAEFLAEERRAIGDWWFRSEYLCEFLDAEMALFAREDIDAAVDGEVEQWELPAAPW